jgi:pimeloyl-ACP methyl ester carboxylesterase
MKAPIIETAGAALLLIAAGCASTPSGQTATGASAGAAVAGAEGAGVLEAAGCPAPEAPSPDTSTPTALDRNLTGYSYPYTVNYLPLSIQGTPACLAYMDVSPQQPKGVVLLLHGKNFSGAYWHSTIERLRQSGYRAIAPDQIGFGKSTKLDSIQYSFDLLAKNTVSLLDALHLDKAVVVGHSMGGMLATRLAASHPDRTQSLVLVDPIGLEDYRRSIPYRGVDALVEQAAKQTPEAVRKYMLDNYFHGDWRPEYEPLLQIQTGWLRGPDAPLLARVSALTQDIIYTQPVVYDFPSIKVPTLLVIGQLDRTAPGKSDARPEIQKLLGNYPALGKAAAQAIPGAQLVELAGVGHVPQYEAFEDWMRALEGFLGTG